MDLSKLFAAWGTGSKADPFRTARFRLTLLYMGIIAAVVLVLSSALYEFHTHDVSGIERRRIVSAPEGEKQGERDPGLGEYLESLGRSMVFADLVTILVGGALSYVLAARTLRPIKRAVESEQRFYANAAHDLRTPLAVMRAEAEVLLRSPEPRLEDARRTLTSSLEEIGRMSKMVEQMLSLARGDNAHPGGRAPFRQIDLAALARNTAAKMALRADQRGVRLSAEAPVHLGIRGDPLAIERALYNVLENAIAYTPSGGSVKVRVQRHGGHVVVSVEDTGIGIPAEDLPHITEPFFRGDQARGTHAAGAGLGLTIAQATISDHRGTLQAASRPGQGTTISLRFPAT
jgi:two-component system, OmpR family, sensor histidine kinase CiaH